MKTYTARHARKQDGREHFAEVTVRAVPCLGHSDVVLSPTCLATLQEVFGLDFEFQRHNVWAAVRVQIGSANVAGEMPYVGATVFRAEVVDVRVSGNAGRELSGYLLTIAGMDAIANFLTEWEKQQAARGRL